MLEEFRRKCAHFYIKRNLLKKETSPISFNKIVSSSQEILIVMPEDDADYSNCFDIIRYFQIHKKNITLFISEFRYNSIPGKEKFSFISFHPDQVTWFFLPNSNLKQRITGKSFDLVLDLNRKENTFFSAISNFVTSKIRLGFNKNRSEGYCNLLFNCKQDDSAAAYFNLLNYIRMF